MNLKLGKKNARFLMTMWWFLFMWHLGVWGRHEWWLIWEGPSVQIPGSRWVASPKKQAYELIWDNLKIVIYSCSDLNKRGCLLFEYKGSWLSWLAKCLWLWMLSLLHIAITSTGHVHEWRFSKLKILPWISEDGFTFTVFAKPESSSFVIR